MLISSEMEEIINLSDRIVVMHEGSVTGVLDNNETSRAKAGRNYVVCFGEGKKCKN